MKRKIRLIAMMLIATLALAGLTACGSENKEVESKNPVDKVVNTIKNDEVSISGDIGAATDVEVAEVEEDSVEYVALASYLADKATNYAAYDITITKDGAAVQPDGKVKVTVKLSDEMIAAAGNAYSVLYVNGAEVTKLACTEKDGYVTFETDHFSIYTVVKYETSEEVESEIEALPTETPTPIPTEPPHEHNYTEVAGSEVAATCTTDGKKADKVCDCGDKVEGEVVKATGHAYGEYKSNGDATYDADGTKTATCTTCGEKDTVADKGSKLERPKTPNLYGMEFNDVTWTHYCMEDTDVYFEPSFQGPVIGHLSVNDTIKVTGWAGNGSKIYRPYTKNEKPTDVNWRRIDYNGQTGYVPSDYTWKSKRNTSITLNPLAANYPTVDGGGSGLFYPYKKEWRYVYGACGNFGNTIALDPNRSSVEIYDGINKNVIATITDHSLKFELTGNAYCTYRDDVGSYYIYEIYYNGSIAYMDSLMAIRQ